MYTVDVEVCVCACVCNCQCRVSTQYSHGARILTCRSLFFVSANFRAQVFVRTDDKLKLLDYLVASGLTTIEATSFVSSRVIPQVSHKY